MDHNSWYPTFSFAPQPLGRLYIRVMPHFEHRISLLCTSSTSMPLVPRICTMKLQWHSNVTVTNRMTVQSSLSPFYCAWRCCTLEAGIVHARVQCISDTAAVHCSQIKILINEQWVTSDCLMQLYFPQEVPSIKLCHCSSLNTCIFPFLYLRCIRIIYTPTYFWTVHLMLRPFNL